MCVQKVSYNFLVNNVLVEPILSVRGLRQGDHLSPYLPFVLRGLFSLLHSENHRRRLHGSRVCRSAPSVSHLFFADDSLLFYKATIEEYMALKNALDLYKRASG